MDCSDFGGTFHRLFYDLCTLTLSFHSYCIRITVQHKISPKLWCYPYQARVVEFEAVLILEMLSCFKTFKIQNRSHVELFKKLHVSAIKNPKIHWHKVVCKQAQTLYTDFHTHALVPLL